MPVRSGPPPVLGATTLGGRTRRELLEFRLPSPIPLLARDLPISCIGRIVRPRLEHGMVEVELLRQAEEDAVLVLPPPRRRVDGPLGVLRRERQLLRMFARRSVAPPPADWR